MKLLTLFLVILLAIVHLSVKYYRKLMEEPRKPLLSFASGTSVGYITVHLLPDFHHVHTHFNEAIDIQKYLEEYSLYIVATVGFLVFYTINHFVKVKTKGNKQEDIFLFIVHMGAFFVYNSFLGYYLIRGLEQDLLTLLASTGVLVLHLMVNDVGIRSDHKHLYDPWGSTLLAIAVSAGWIVGYFTKVPTIVYGIWFGWLAGGILLNIIKDELPNESKGKLIPFVSGASISTILFIFI